MGEESPARRVSLTKSQLQTEIGAGLLSICQSVTSDGRIADSEIAELDAWLSQSRNSDLPGLALLRDVVGKAIADGQISAEERAQIHKALESVLPLELRKSAVAARREVEKQERATERAAKAAERELSRPVDRANFMVAGCRFDDRPSVIRECVRPETTVHLRRDRGNQYSRHAIGVHVEDGRRIGFVPDDEAAGLAHILDGGGRAEAWVTKLLGNRDKPIPVVQASFYRTGGSAAAEADFRDQAPPAVLDPTPRGKLDRVVWMGIAFAILFLGFMIVKSCQSPGN